MVEVIAGIYEPARAVQMTIHRRDLVVIGHGRQVQSIARRGSFARLPPTAFRIAACLCSSLASKRPVSDADIIEACWGDDADGGPLDSCINVHVYRIRQALAPLGIFFEKEQGRGFRAWATI